MLIHFLLAARPLAAQDIRPGEIAERVIAKDHPDQSYSVYVPRNYTHDGAWPIVFVFDPGARAGTTLPLFREGAEKFGYIVMCSWNSRNGAWSQTAAAMAAKWDDAAARCHIDPKRIYTAGFSGGARAAITFAITTKQVAGVIAGGAALSGQNVPKDVPFSLFLETSTGDFNWSEVHASARQLASLGASHRLIQIDGPHRWPPAAIITQGIEWLTIDAMRRHLRPADPALITAFTKSRLAEIDALADSPYEQLQAYDFLIHDLESLSPTPELAPKAAALRGSKPVKAGLKRQLDAEKREADSSREFDRLLRAADASIEGLEPARAFLARLTKAAASPNNNEARRQLSGASAFLLESRRELESRKQYPALARRLELATELPGARANPYLELAAAYLNLKDKRSAKAALDRGVKKGAVTPEQIKADPRLANLTPKEQN